MEIENFLFTDTDSNFKFAACRHSLSWDHRRLCMRLEKRHRVGACLYCVKCLLFFATKQHC